MLAPSLPNSPDKNCNMADSNFETLAYSSFLDSFGNGPLLTSVQHKAGNKKQSAGSCERPSESSFENPSKLFEETVQTLPTTSFMFPNITTLPLQTPSTNRHPPNLSPKLISVKSMNPYKQLTNLQNLLNMYYNDNFMNRKQNMMMIRLIHQKQKNNRLLINDIKALNHLIDCDIQYKNKIKKKRQRRRKRDFSLIQARIESKKDRLHCLFRQVEKLQRTLSLSKKKKKSKCFSLPKPPHQPYKIPPKHFFPKYQKPHSKETISPLKPPQPTHFDRITIPAQLGVKQIHQDEHFQLTRQISLQNQQPIKTKSQHISQQQKQQTGRSRIRKTSSKRQSRKKQNMQKSIEREEQGMTESVIEIDTGMDSIENDSYSRKKSVQNNEIQSVVPRSYNSEIVKNFTPKTINTSLQYASQELPKPTIPAEYKIIEGSQSPTLRGYQCPEDDEFDLENISLQTVSKISKQKQKKKKIPEIKQIRESAQFRKSQQQNEKKQILSDKRYSYTHQK